MYFVTDAASALPSEADWPAVWAAQQEFKAAKKAHDDTVAAVSRWARRFLFSKACLWPAVWAAQQEFMAGKKAQDAAIAAVRLWLGGMA